MELKSIGKKKITWISIPNQSFCKSKVINLLNFYITKLWGACINVVSTFVFLLDFYLVSELIIFFRTLHSSMSLNRSKPDSQCLNTNKFVKIDSEFNKTIYGTDSNRIKPYSHLKEIDTQSYLCIKRCKDIWESCNISNREKLARYAQEILKLTHSQFKTHVCFFLPYQIINDLFTDMKHYTKMTTLLHIFSMVSVHGQAKKKKWILKELTSALIMTSDTDLYSIFNQFLDQLMTIKSKEVEEDLCIGGMNPYLELLLKLCYSEKLLEQKEYDQYKEFIAKNVYFITTNIEEMKTMDEYETVSKSCIFILHALNVNKTRHQPDQLCNNEYLTSTLSELLSILAEDYVYVIFKKYLKQIEIMNSQISVQDLLIWKIDPHQNLLLKLLIRDILMKKKHCKLYKECMVQNRQFFSDVITKGCCNTVIDVSRTILHDCDKSCDQINTLEKKGYQVTTSFLCSLLYKLPEENLYETISWFFILVKKMKSDINSDYLNSIKTDPYLELIFKLFWCRKLVKEGNADNYIVNNCLLHFYRKHFEENQPEFIALIISLTDNLSQKSLLKEILQSFLRRYLKPVTSMATKTHGNMGCEWNEKKTTDEKRKQDLIYAHCACIYSGKKIKNVDIKQYSRMVNLKGPEDENETEMQSEQVKLLILFKLLLLLTALGHKSAKLKKYLALKYEYDMASLYLLWCSGDIEVHPGPSWRRKQLEHNSERERKWLQDINSILLKLYWRIPTHSKPKDLWQKDNQPEQWPSDNPFYDTKNASKDAKGNKITDDEILTCLLECLKKKEVDIPQIYQSELSAWRNDNIQLLHKLQVFRIEMENVKSASFNLYLSNLEGNTQNLQDIKVSIEKLTLDKMQIEGQLINDHRQKKQAEIVAEITRDLANTLCRLAKGTDPMEKGDGIWNTPPPVDWPDDVPFFNPKNRGKNKDKPKCPDTVLVCTFLKLQYLKIPENLQQIVDAYKTLFNCTDIDRKKKNKEKLCRLYTVQSNWEKLDCSLHNLYKEGLFSREVHAILNQWWKTQSVDKNAENVLKNALVRSDERPHITIGITKVFRADSNLRHISYTIHIKDAFLNIKCTTVNPSQSSHEHTITGPLVPANNSENIEDSILPSDLINFVLENDYVDQTKCSNNNSVINTDNGPTPFDLQRQPVTHQHLKNHNDLDTLTTHNTLASDLNDSRCTTVYDTTSLQGCNSGYSLNNRTGENLGGNMGTSKVKRKQIEDDEEPVKKLLKTKCDQFGHYNSPDEEISSSESKNDGGSQEPNHISTSNQHDICSANVQDLPSLELSLSDIIDGIGDKCNSKPSKDSVTFQQICDLENINSSNKQDSHENIDELKNNDNQIHHTKEDQDCLEMIKSLYR